MVSHFAYNFVYISQLQPQMKLDAIKPTPPPANISPKNLAGTDEILTARVKKERIDIQDNYYDRNDGGIEVNNSNGEHRMTEISFDEHNDKENANPKDFSDDIDLPHEEDMVIEF